MYAKKYKKHEDALPNQLFDGKVLLKVLFLEIELIITLHRRFRKESQVKPGEKITVSDPPQKPSLTIKTVKGSDAGEYTCRLLNQQEQVKHEVKFIVEVIVSNGKRD